MTCPWCNHVYDKYTRRTEWTHLGECTGFQGLPSEVIDGEEYVRVPLYPNILVRRDKSN